MNLVQCSRLLCFHFIRAMSLVIIKRTETAVFGVFSPRVWKRWMSQNREKATDRKALTATTKKVFLPTATIKVTSGMNECIYVSKHFLWYFQRGFRFQPKIKNGSMCFLSYHCDHTRQSKFSRFTQKCLSSVRWNKK